MPVKMDDVREVKLKRSDSIGLGFSVFGGKGSEFPPVIYQVVDESPAAVCGVLEAGDIILEVNDKQVVSLTTKEVLKCLRLSNDVVRLKVKKDARIKERVHHHMAASNELEALRRSHVKENSGSAPNGHPHKQQNGDLRENGENIPPSDHRPPPDKPKFEAFMMTGELIIKTKSVSNSVSPKRFKQAPQLKSNKIEEDIKSRENSSSKQQVSSPEEEKKGTLSYGGNFVRTSRSEDFLQKSSVSAVNIDLEEEEEDTAASLDNLPTAETTYDDTRTGQFIHITTNNTNTNGGGGMIWGPRDDGNRIVIDVKGEGAAASSRDEQPTKQPQLQERRSGSPEDESDVESLSSFHYSPKAIDMPSASRLAKRLFNLEGFKKSDVSLHLYKKVVAEEYLKFFDFHGDTLDVALRKFLKQFSLIGETQERERVLVHFSKRYLDCNPGAFKSQDAVHTLTCALMLLNSDLHRENASRRMSCAEFVENLSELNEGENFSKDVLKALYHSIKTTALVWAVDDEEEEEKPTEEKSSSQHDKTQNFIGHNPFLEVPNPNFATEYKKGYVMRKCCVDPNGKKTPMGKRGWKMFYADLRDLVLYLHKDENGFRKNQLYDSLHNSIRIHHAIATRATDYTKKQHVFRLQTADQAVYLFQTRYYRKDHGDDMQQDDSKELQSWIDTINYVAACLSAPSLAEAVGAQKKFQRPLLPVAPTKLNFREQLLDLESKVMRLEKEIEEHLSNPPEKSAKSRVVNEYVEKEHFLQYELKRYRTYIFLLRSKVAHFPELEPPLVETSIGEVDENLEKNDQTPIVPTSVSDPTCTTEKRRFTDRFSYRAAIYKTDPSDNGA